MMLPLMRVCVCVYVWACVGVYMFAPLKRTLGPSMGWGWWLSIQVRVT